MTYIENFLFVKIQIELMSVFFMKRHNMIEVYTSKFERFRSFGKLVYFEWKFVLLIFVLTRSTLPNSHRFSMFTENESQSTGLYT